LAELSEEGAIDRRFSWRWSARLTGGWTWPRQPAYHTFRASSTAARHLEIDDIIDAAPSVSFGEGAGCST
jgi:hypothetical protein